MKTIVDTNVFSKIFQGNSSVQQLIEGTEAFVDTTIYIECLQGSKSQIEKKHIKLYLATFPLIRFQTSISETAIDLIDQYSNSFGLSLPDALIASSALTYDLTLMTYNLSDFHFIEGLLVKSPEDFV